MFSFLSCRRVLGLFLWLTVLWLSEAAAWTCSTSPPSSWILLRRCYAARSPLCYHHRDHCWQHPTAQSAARPERRQPQRGTQPTDGAFTTTLTRLQLAGQQPAPDWWDRFRNSLPEFLQERSGDFVPLEDDNDSSSTTTTKNQPLLLVLYRVPAGIHDDEIYDMLTDGAPIAVQQGVQIRRLSSSAAAIDDHDTERQVRLLDLPLREALAQLQHRDHPDVVHEDESRTVVVTKNELPSSSTSSSNGGGIEQQQQVAVLLFRGFINTEMLQVYRILAAEINVETSGQCLVACAKVVPRALDKPLRQVLEEIASDHRNAVA